MNLSDEIPREPYVDAADGLTCYFSLRIHQTRLPGGFIPFFPQLPLHPNGNACLLAFLRVSVAHHIMHTNHFLAAALKYLWIQGLSWIS